MPVSDADRREAKIRLSTRLDDALDEVHEFLAERGVTDAAERCDLVHNLFHEVIDPDRAGQVFPTADDAAPRPTDRPYLDDLHDD